MNHMPTVAVVPACGHGARFQERGHPGPKHLLPVAGRPMVAWVLDALAVDGLPTAVAVRNVADIPERTRGSLPARTAVVPVHPSACARGAPETLLHCLSAVPLDAPVLVVNCDNVIRPLYGWNQLIDHWHSAGASAAAVTFAAPALPPGVHGPFSYVQAQGARVQHVAEKYPTTAQACAGAFWFSSYGLLLRLARRHLEGPPDYKTEHYLAPVLNEFIALGMLVAHYEIQPRDIFVRMGVPEDLPAAEAVLQHMTPLAG